MPTWAAAQSLIMGASQQNAMTTVTNTEVLTPLLRRPPTDYQTLYTALKLTQEISAVVVGPDRKTLITLDLDLFSRALKIQQSVGNDNWILLPGKKCVF